MVKINKFCGMFYKIDMGQVDLEVVEDYENRPSTYIGKKFLIDRPDFWNFIFDVVTEAKKEYLSRIDNDDGEWTPNQVNKAKLMVEKLENIEKELDVLCHYN